MNSNNTYDLYNKVNSSFDSDERSKNQRRNELLSEESNLKNNKNNLNSQLNYLKNILKMNSLKKKKNMQNE